MRELRSTVDRVPTTATREQGRVAATAGAAATRLAGVAERLGVSVATLENYLRAHGGVPGRAAGAAPASARESGAPTSVAREPAVAAGAKADAPWVKRDRPRYFIAG